MAGKDKLTYSRGDQRTRTLGAETGKTSVKGALSSKNKMSSARGPYQILDGTWKELEKSAGRKLDRNSEDDNNMAFELYTKKSEKALEQNGMEVNPGNTYALHVFGQAGGVGYLKRMKSNPEGLSTDGMPSAVINGNKPFFYDEKGNPRTNSDSYRKISSRVGGPDDPGAITMQKENRRSAVVNQIREQQAQQAQAQQQNQFQNQEQRAPVDENGNEVIPEEVQQEMARQDAPPAPVSELSAASNSAGLMYSGNPGGRFILPKQEAVVDGVKTSGEASMKAKTFSYGGELTPEQVAAKKASQIAGAKKMNELGLTPTTKVFENKESFDTKKIVKYQPGVSSGNESGFYLYSKDPVNGGFNPERDREFVKQSEMMDVQRTPQWAEYSAMMTAKNKAQQKPVASLDSVGFADGGEINNGLLNDFNVGGTHEENPNGGIQQGIGSNGMPNTVEEGETKMNNYVFSDRLTLDKADVDNLYLPKEVEGMTFADASKFINEFLEENPFDIIIKRTAESQLDSLKVGNDRARVFKEKEEAVVAENEQVKQMRFSGSEQPEEELAMQQAELSLSPEDQEIAEQQESEESQMAYGGYVFKGNNKYVNGTELDVAGAVSGAKTGAGPDASAYLGAASTALSMGMDTFQKYDTTNLDNIIVKQKGGISAAKGAISGASAGAAFGPWGLAAGAVIGGGLGLIGAGRANKAANEQDINISGSKFNNMFGDLAPETSPVISNNRVAAYGGNQFKYGDKGEGTFNNEELSKKMAEQYFLSKGLDASGNSSFGPQAEYKATSWPNYTMKDPTSTLNKEDEKAFYSNPANAVKKEDKKAGFKIKNDSPLKYAGAVGALSNYINSRKEKARDIRSEMITKVTTPNYFDEAIIDNKMNQEMNNRSQAILATAGGSAASARAMQYANSSEINKLKSDSYFKMFEGNNAIRDKDQAEIQRISDSNTGQRNLDYQANLQEQDYVQGRKEKARDNLYSTVEAIGQEQSDKNLVYNLSGGYKGGNYDPEDKTGLNNVIANAFRGRNKRDNGGVMDYVVNYEKAQDEKRNKIIEVNRRYNG